MTIDPPKVFISYAHESEEHKALVLAFATFLRSVGVEAVLDRWAEDARRDWPAWAIREMTGADYVLVIASARYRQSGDGHSLTSDNRGVQSEAALLREIVYGDRATWLPKILPVLLPGHGVDEVPLFLQPHSASRYPVRSFDVAGADDLLRVILRQPGHPAPEVASERQVLPPHSPASVPPPEGSAPGRVVNQVNGNVTGNVVQADTIKGDITFR